MTIGRIVQAGEQILSSPEVHTADPTSLLFNEHRRPFVWDKMIGTSIQPLTPSNCKVNNGWN